MTTARTGPKFKMVLLGEAGVGKTSLFFRIMSNFYSETTLILLGIDSCSRLVPLDENSHLTLSVWDTGGFERFQMLTKNYYRNAHVCALIFSLDDPTSFHKLSKWVDDARDFATSSLKILVGNKSDLEQQVEPQLIDNFADINNIDLIFAVSAKTGDGIDNMLETIGRKLVDRSNQASGAHQMSRESELVKANDEFAYCQYC